VLSYLAARAIPGVESVGPGAYRRTARAGNAGGTLEVGLAPDRRHLKLTVGFTPDVELIQVVERVRRIFDLDADPLAIGSHLRQDRRLATRLRAGADLRVPGAWEGFELAVRAILDRLPGLELIDPPEPHGFAFRRPPELRLRWRS